MASRQILSDFDFNSVARILNLPDAASDQEPATLAQVKAAIEGLAWKDNARVAAPGNVNTASPGASIDGVAMAANDRVLLPAQTTSSQNGLYIWNGAAVAMTRALDANSVNDLENAVVSIDEGTSAGSSFRQQSVNFVVGTDPITWTAFGTVTPAATETTAGKAEIATQTETDTGTDDTRIVTPLKLATWAGRKFKATATIGDAAATSFTVNHNFNTRDIQVSVYRSSGNYDEVLCEVRHNTVNQCTLVFASAPSLNQFAVVITA